MTTIVCGRFRRCTRPAAGMTRRDAELVPVCAPCAMRYGLTFVPTTPTVNA